MSLTSDQLREYFTPGALLSTCGGFDRVLGFALRDGLSPPFSRFAVTVQRCNAAGVAIEAPRTHWTEPTRSQYITAMAERTEYIIEQA